jgi:hypothetical protein
LLKKKKSLYKFFGYLNFAPNFIFIKKKKKKKHKIAHTFVLKTKTKTNLVPNKAMINSTVICLDRKIHKLTNF